ncbi:RsmE family RNA methyltransferase [Lacticaseibacillus baoqingensis]|uniref:Ribosomal RNA small subunit methyltransferase E n=1 Tax=Lacticaseibacillus baoqingensis TaxID=2486013 RepID=A0ABW4EA08_9LACO|nr:RsmE family RNA methyltransferase [Lacticaseibacillus baoqingensis]
MMRFFTQQPLTLGARVTLEPALQKHAIKVLRLAEGAQFELADDRQHAFVATIQTTAPLVVSVDTPITRVVELPVCTRLICGVPKGDKADWIVQKATELGASQITFFNSQWATAKWKAERVAKKLTRLQAIAQGAAEQSHRDRIPTVSFARLADLTLEEGQVGLIAYEEAAKAGEAATLVQTIAKQPQALACVFGPEGGISPEEVTALTARGFIPAGLGPRIMRTETAPLYLLSAISALTELQEI